MKPEPEASDADLTGPITGGERPALAAGSDADDLASLGSELVSLRPGEASEAVEDESNLGALTAAGATRIDRGADAEAEDTRLDLGRLVAAATRNAERGPAPGGKSPSAAVAAAPGLESVLAVTAASLVPPRQRASWVVPMLVGVGVGAVIAGAAFGLTGGQTPAPLNVPTVAARRDAPASPTAAEAAPSVQGELPVRAPSAASPTAMRAAAPSRELAADSSALHSAGRSLADTHPVAPRRPVAPESSVVARMSVTPATPATPATPDNRTSLLKPKEPATTPGPTSLEALAEAADPGATEGQGEASAKSPTGSVDQLLDEALAPQAQRLALRQQHALAVAAEQLPATPTRDDVTKAMTVLLPAIRGCAMGQSGLMTAGIVVRNDGRVASVDIAGAPFANTPSGRCMEGVMRRAQFPRFKQPIFRIKFPFAIQ